MSRSFGRLWAVFCVLIWMTGAATAQGLTGLARLDATRTGLSEARGGATLTIGLSQPVPYRVYTLTEPNRLVVDFSVLDWTGTTPTAWEASDLVLTAQMGPYQPGWSRLVLELATPLVVTEAWMDTGAQPLVTVRLEDSSPEVFAAAAGAPLSTLFSLPQPVDLPPAHRRQDGSRPVVVMLDPGHGGIDPGAERDGVTEAHLMLTFARELQALLHRSGDFDVRLTRDGDVFVPLERRVSLARAAGADVFLSLHADALAEGRASGATIYTLSAEASDIASEKLAERHDRGDLLAGVDLSEQDDRIAHVLMELARTETIQRTDMLAEAMVAGLEERIGGLYKHPRLEASFSVLKAADIPSVLIELGFLSSDRDRENLLDPKWREKAALGIRDALAAWAIADAANAALLRQ